MSCSVTASTQRSVHTINLCVHCVVFRFFFHFKLPGLLLSQTPNTVKMRMNPRKNSNPNPCHDEIPRCRVVCPTLTTVVLSTSISCLSDHVPADAPAHWEKMYNNARMRLILPVTNMATDTAGLICPPLTCPIA